MTRKSRTPPSCAAATSRYRVALHLPAIYLASDDDQRLAICCSIQVPNHALRNAITEWLTFCKEQGSEWAADEVDSRKTIHCQLGNDNSLLVDTTDTTDAAVLLPAHGVAAPGVERGVAHAGVAHAQRDPRERPAWNYWDAATAAAVDTLPTLLTAVSTILFLLLVRVLMRS